MVMFGKYRTIVHCLKEIVYKGHGHFHDPGLFSEGDLLLLDLYFSTEIKLVSLTCKVHVIICH